MVEIYVDGSFSKDIGKFAGWAFVVVQDGVEHFNKNGLTKEEAKSWNVDGEVYATIEGIKYCIDNNIKEVTICYDYTGIENWATSIWKCKSNISKKYVQFIQDNKDVKLNFRKIKSHSGDKFNNLADKLATQALWLVKKGDINE